MRNLLGNLLISFALSGHGQIQYQVQIRCKVEIDREEIRLGREIIGKESEIVDVTAEDGDHVEPPPPEVVEPDPELTPEEAEQARKDYLLTRFWISARGYWGRGGDRLAWMFTIGLLILIVANVGFQYGINVWNRAIFDAIEKRESATVFYLTAVFFPLAIGSVLLGVAQVFARMGIQRRWRAWLTKFGDDALARQWPLLPAQPRRRRPQESGIPDRRGSCGSQPTAGGFHRRRHLGVAFGRNLHRGALDHRRRADGDARWIGRDDPRLPGDRRGALRRDRLRLDHDDRPPLRAGLRGQEPGRGRISLRADPRARERREHRAARRRGGRARRHRQEFHQRAAAMVAACPPAHAHHAGVAGIEPDCAGGAAVAVRAKIPRRQHDARTGDAGGLRLHHRAERVRLAGRQLSAARRLERLRAPHRLADDVARRAGARRARRRHRPHQARRDRGRRPCSA